MNNKRGIPPRARVLILGICFILLISFVSAGWFSDFFDKFSGGITGNAITNDCTNVVGLYHFDGDASDSSGNGNDGVVNGATQTTGHLGSGAYSFDGVDDYVDLGTNNNLFSSSDFSVSVWVKPTNSDGEYVVSGETIFGPTISFYSGKILFSRQNGEWIGYSSSSVNNNFWNHVVVTYDSLGNYTIYLDGQLSGKGNKSVSFNSVNTIIGSFSGTSKFYNGTIDELAI